MNTKQIMAVIVGVTLFIANYSHNRNFLVVGITMAVFYIFGLMFGIWDEPDSNSSQKS